MPGSETAALRQSEGQSTRINSQLVSSDANRIAGPAPAGYNGDSVSYSRVSQTPSRRQSRRRRGVTWWETRARQRHRH